MTPFAENEFRNATRSEPHKTCVRVARRDGRVEVRDDKIAFGSPEDHRLVFTDEQFDAFLQGVRAGEAAGLCLEMVRQEGDTFAFRSTVEGSGVELIFTDAEVSAFLDGVHKHEFDLVAYAA